MNRNACVVLKPSEHSTDFEFLPFRTPTAADGEGCPGKSRDGDKPPLILVVDDDATTRLVARAVLESAGCQVVECADGAQALAAFSLEIPDLILLDVMMPVLDGFATCAALRRRPGGKHIPVLMVTGQDDVESIRRAFEVGATAFDAKPINPAILEHRVRYLLRHSRTTRKLAENEAILANAQRLARLGSWGLDLVKNEFRCSQSLCRLLGQSSCQGGMTLDSLLAPVHCEDRGRVRKILTTAIEERQPFTLSYRIRWTDGALRSVYHQGEVVYDDAGRPALMTGIVQDFTEMNEIQEQIRVIAFYDALTGLPNRMLFKENLKQALQLSKQHGSQLALLQIDLDRFKRINDTLGHRFGDLLLVEVTARLHTAVGNSQAEAAGVSLARLGGDEFALLLTDIEHPQDAAKLARRMLDLLTAPVLLEGREVFVTPSIGIALAPGEGDDSETLLRNAGQALSAVRGSGGNGYRFYEASANAAAARQLDLESELRRALMHDQFELYYQPQVDARDGRLIGAEALIRWVHPQRGVVPPMEFIPLAEETGLIIALNEWVLQSACRQHRAWRDAGLEPCRIAVNLSCHGAILDCIAETVDSALRAGQLDPRFLQVELTESLVMQGEAKVVSELQRLKSLGVGIAIDDFGTGYSSLSYLKKFPIDTLKIDRSFVRDLPDDVNDAAIIRAIIAMAHHLDLQVVAEGVETSEQASFLRALGCEELQGFLFSRPVPAAEFAELLRRKDLSPCQKPLAG